MSSTPINNASNPYVFSFIQITTLNPWQDDLIERVQRMLVNIKDPYDWNTYIHVEISKKTVNLYPLSKL